MTVGFLALKNLPQSLFFVCLLNAHAYNGRNGKITSVNVIQFPSALPDAWVAWWAYVFPRFSDAPLQKENCFLFEADARAVITSRGWIFLTQETNRSLPIGFSRVIQRPTIGSRLIFLYQILYKFGVTNNICTTLFYVFKKFIHSHERDQPLLCVCCSKWVLV